MKKPDKTRLVTILLFFLAGCSNPTASAVTPEVTLIPTSAITFSTATSKPTKTFSLCPPRLETELPKPDISENYIGKVFRDLPQELESEYGGLIDSKNRNEYEKQYAFSEIINTSNRQRLLWFEKELCANSENQTFFEIIDVIALSFNEDDMVMEPEYCMLDKVIDPEIFALGSRELNPKNLTIIDRAWRANRKTEKFEEISTERVECLGEDLSTEDAGTP